MVERDKKGHFKKGSIPNPNGRPKKGEAITDLIRKYLQKKAPGIKGKLTYKDLFVKKLFQKCFEGDLQALKLIINYIDGMPLQTTDLLNKGDIGIHLISKEEDKI